MSRHLSQCWSLPLGRAEGNGHVTSLMVTTENMVSRRKILSQSRDELSYVQEEEEDVWYTKDKLFKVEIIIFNIYFESLHMSPSPLLVL